MSILRVLTDVYDDDTVDRSFDSSYEEEVDLGTPVYNLLFFFSK